MQDYCLFYGGIIRGTGKIQPGRVYSYSRSYAAATLIYRATGKENKPIRVNIAYTAGHKTGCTQPPAATVSEKIAAQMFRCITCGRGCSFRSPEIFFYLFNAKQENAVFRIRLCFAEKQKKPAVF